MMKKLNLICTGVLAGQLFHLPNEAPVWYVSLLTVAFVVNLVVGWREE